MILRLQNLAKKYGDRTALADVTADVAPGAVGLLGPNGAGKSTLIKLLLGLVRVSGGRAEVLGRDVARDSRDIRRVVGYMPEDDCIIPGLRGIEAVAYAGELAGIPPRAALRRAHEMLDYCFIGEERYREVQTFSTGMRQKVRLAQALVHAPELLFLDEPTSGLDPEGRERMLHLVRDLARERGISVVVSTHILKDVEACCDSILVLAAGRVLVYDSLESLQKTVDSDLRVRFHGDGQRFAKALGDAGLPCEHGSLPGELRLPHAAEGIVRSREIFAAARQADASVREIRPGKNSLEQIFLDAVHAEAAVAGS